MSDEYVMAIALGPVQEFIAAARKTRDLWYGSELLSRTAKAAALALRDGGATLIFPAADLLEREIKDDAEETLPIANKIVAIVPSRAPAELAEQARAAAMDYLRAEMERALGRVRALRQIHMIAVDLVTQQVETFLEWYAAWYPYDSADPDGFAAARDAVDELLAGRKALRDFKPARGRAGVPKSALDGGREAVVAIGDRGNGLGRNDESALASLSIKAGEYLDGISLVKRLATQRRFVSLSRVAIDPVLRRLAQPELEHLRQVARELVQSPLVESLPISAGLEQYRYFPFDTELFYTDPGGPAATVDGLTDGQRAAAGRFTQELHALVKADPPAYLAVLVADGDRMGQWIHDLRTPEEHAEFSRTGVSFARRAERVVAAHHGALVYSGGDDVLAFLPLDQAVACAHALKVAFAEEMAAPIGAATGGAAGPTLTVGLAIGHVLTPMHTLLAWGRAAEAMAKRRRNALAIALHTRSGGSDTLVAIHGWEEDPLARYNHWVAWYREERLPDGAAYELRALARELRELSLPERDAIVGELLMPEVRRILTRKRGERGGRKLTAPEITTILQHLETARASAEPAADGGLTFTKRVENGPSSAPTTTNMLAALERLVDELIIARQLARARDVAEGRLRRVMEQEEVGA
jgi:CRISPR-associated protein Cmr2